MKKLLLILATGALVWIAPPLASATPLLLPSTAQLYAQAPALQSDEPYDPKCIQSECTTVVSIPPNGREVRWQSGELMSGATLLQLYSTRKGKLREILNLEDINNCSGWAYHAGVTIKLGVCGGVNVPVKFKAHSMAKKTIRITVTYRVIPDYGAK